MDVLNIDVSTGQKVTGADHIELERAIVEPAVRKASGLTLEW